MGDTDVVPTRISASPPVMPIYAVLSSHSAKATSASDRVAVICFTTSSLAGVSSTRALSVFGFQMLIQQGQGYDDAGS